MSKATLRARLAALCIAGALAASMPGAAAAKENMVALDGNSLTPAQVAAIARDGARVEIEERARRRVEDSHALLLEAAKDGHKIYGLTTGVGLRKDQTIVNVDGDLSEDVIELSRQFNRNLIYAHSAGAGPEMEPRVVRALMATRLNSILYGATGVQPRVAELYRDFLNHGIVPVLPSRGSLGEADITIITHVGLAMIGEGEVHYDGERMPAARALRSAGLKPLEAFGKDALSILSSNAYSEALAAFAAHEIGHVASIARMVFALSLEAINGNVAPFLEGSNRVRPMRYFNAASQDLRDLLAGSYLWQESEQRALQDPLSYRTAAYTLAAVDRALAEVGELLAVQLNSSDDNPAVVLDIEPASDRPQETRYFVDQGGGAVMPTANFEPLPWVIAFERSAIALGHLSHAAAQRTIKLADPAFTGLTRFLGADESGHAYGAIQKTFVDLSMENRALADPVSMDYFAVAGNIEDTATNAPRVIRRVRSIVDNLYYVLGLELMHAAQAIDLRRQQGQIGLSAVTGDLFQKFRGRVSFMSHDRPLTPDIEAAYQFLKACRIGPADDIDWARRSVSCADS